LAIYLPIFLFISPVCYAQIYKWVDANGQTHFSERKSAAGDKAIELKPVAPSTAPQSSDSSAQYWQEQERSFRERQIIKRMAEQLPGPRTAKKPESLSGGTRKWEDTDTWRCNLARDIISGAVKRANRSPTTQDDIKLAEENVRAFCR